VNERWGLQSRKAVGRCGRRSFPADRRIGDGRRRLSAAFPTARFPNSSARDLWFAPNALAHKPPSQLDRSKRILRDVLRKSSCPVAQADLAPATPYLRKREYRHAVKHQLRERRLASGCIVNRAQRWFMGALNTAIDMDAPARLARLPRAAQSRLPAVIALSDYSLCNTTLIDGD
jgi:hypothetical protein